VGRERSRIAAELDIVVSVLNAQGSKLVFSTYLGGTGDDFGDLNIDAAGAAYVSGFTCSDDYPVTTGAFQTTPAGGCDGMVTKIGITDGAGAAVTVHGGPSPARCLQAARRTLAEFALAEGGVAAIRS